MSCSLMINSSMAMIVTLFLLANVSYFLVLPFDIVRPLAHPLLERALTPLPAGNSDDDYRCARQLAC